MLLLTLGIMNRAMLRFRIFVIELNLFPFNLIVDIVSNEKCYLRISNINRKVIEFFFPS